MPTLRVVCLDFTVIRPRAPSKAFIIDTLAVSSTPVNIAIGEHFEIT